jgi:hypothetical protein
MGFLNRVGIRCINVCFEGFGSYRNLDRTRYYSLFRTNKERCWFSFFMTQSAKGNLGFLNNTVGVFEYESKPDGTSKGKIWERR